MVARLLPLGFIDEPALAVRRGFDPGNQHELEESIKANGLIEPLVVRARGSRFEVVAGHRRLLACRVLGWFEVPCVVRDLTDRQAESIKIAENKDRLDTNPADEAAYYAELLERFCNNDVIELEGFTGQTYAYLSDRLNLLRGDEMILTAISESVINLGVAKELNRIKSDTDRRQYLHTAVETGASVAEVRRWRLKLEQFLALQGEPPAASPAAVDATAPRESHGPLCIVCRNTRNPHQLRLFHVHDYCDQAILDPLLVAYHNGAPTDGTK